MQKPTIHLNGTSRAELERIHEEAHRALTEAIDKLNDAAPNARDFYVQSSSAYTAAAAEHRDRTERLASVRAEIEILWAHIVDHP